eukprot:m.350304 g.350304  ORF g.350304 m.350304 type:complete len:81 (-) comp16158_c0_seq2:1581-1823(-)
MTRRKYNTNVLRKHVLPVDDGGTTERTFGASFRASATEICMLAGNMLHFWFNVKADGTPRVIISILLISVLLLLEACELD